MPMNGYGEGLEMRVCEVANPAFYKRNNALIEFLKIQGYII